MLWVELVFVLTGRPMLKKIGIVPKSRVGQLVLAYALGAGVGLGCLFALGILGLYSNTGLTLFFLCWTAGAVFANGDLRSRDSPYFLARGQTLHRGEIVLLSLIAAYLTTFLFHTLTPEISYDALVYHLGFPNLWLLKGRLTFPLTYCFSGMPLNTELLYGLALALSDGVLAKLIHFGFGVATLGAMYLIVRQFASRASALAAILIFLAMPMVALDFLWAASDLSAVFFGLLASYALVNALRHEEKRRAWMVIGGIFCGLAMGCKYPAWILLPVLIGAWIGQTGKANTLGWFIGPAAVAVSPWILKNMLVFHNPVYPFLVTKLTSPGAHLVNWDLLQSEAARRFSTLLSFKGLGAYCIEPWTATMGQSGGNYLGPALLATAPAIAAWPRQTGISFWRKLTVLGTLLVTLLSFMPRFWLPALASLAVLIACSLDALESKVLKRWIALLVIFVSTLNLWWTHRYFMQWGGWKVTMGELSRSDYLQNSQAHYQTPYYPAAVFVNTHAPEKASVLLLGDTRSFYLERAWIGASLFDAHPFFRWANQAPDGNRLYDKLQAENLSWILFNPAEATRMRRYWVDQVAPHGEKVLADFWSHHVLLQFNDVQTDGKEYRADSVLLVVPELPPHTRPLPNVLGQILESNRPTSL